MIPLGTIAQQTVTQPAEPFYFGTTSGILLSAPYIPSAGGIPFVEQVNLIKSIGGNSTRFGMASSFMDDTGTVGTQDRINQITDYAAAAHAQGLTIVMMIQDRMYSLDWAQPEIDFYNAGYALANGFVNNYKGIFTDKIYELSNEIELFRDLKDDLLDQDGDGSTTDSLGPGTERADYNSRFENAVAYITGMEAGVKAAEPTARTIFNTASWAPTYLWQEVFAAAPTINYCGLHWYHEMQSGWGNNTYPGGQQGMASIIDLLYSRWGKKVWVTEANARWDRPPYDPPDMTDLEREQRQLDFHNEFHTICANNPNCVGYQIHRLLTVTNSDGDYGIFHFPGLSGNNYEETITPRLLATYLINQNG